MTTAITSADQGRNSALISSLFKLPSMVEAIRAMGMVPSPIIPSQATPIQLRGSNESLHSALFPISNRFTAGKARASTVKSPSTDAPMAK